MNVQLKQSEIVEAIKQYITKQGINLSGKDVAINFTAGRKESGITAEVAIEDAGIPGFADVKEDDIDVKEDDTDGNASKPSGLTVVSDTLDPTTEAQEDISYSEAEAEESEVSKEALVAKTTSLFN